jgi:hypothetical protein
MRWSDSLGSDLLSFWACFFLGRRLHGRLSAVDSGVHIFTRRSSTEQQRLMIVVFAGTLLPYIHTYTRTYCSTQLTVQTVSCSNLFLNHVTRIFGKLLINCILFSQFTSGFPKYISDLKISF